MTALQARANEYAAGSRAINTRRAYKWGWKPFEAWCRREKLAALPASGETLARYLADMADNGFAVASIKLALTAISQQHEAAGVENPRGTRAVRDVSKGIRRTKSVRQVQKAPILIPMLRAMVAALPRGTKSSIRDAAILLLGFSGAFRRSELVSLQLEDIEFTGDGVRILLRKSKTNQEGKPDWVNIPNGEHEETCPVRALKSWITELCAALFDLHPRGPVFREITRYGNIKAGLTARAVAEVVKARASAAGFDPAMYSGHSLRSGLATSAAQAGKPEREIMAQTRHKSTEVLRRYIRAVTPFAANAAKGIGL